ncbi:restriction endonuclease subunit S [Gallibacterium sp. AGMB14963]|uniref:restriction endonuclease subunit S n=1 Tax=Gallibacterium faecale TaxID=3019086 RepID=UPI0022F1BC95|nr:restriction endonuclease subunit S [Gallibacterium sp. AGMB14963]MDA3978335.1 restriction endonuclease subunit S [Gallibacterium sp. AGMB14963]
MSEWKKYKLGEIFDFTTGKLDSNQAIEKGKYPFFTCSPTTLSIDSYAFDTEAVLLAGNNANAIYPIKYYSGKFNAYQRTYVITPKKDKEIDLKWFYFKLHEIINNLSKQSSGTATKFLTKKILSHYEINIPDINIQKKITNILWNLDNKIQLNIETNQTLEAIAQAIFKHWFIDFAPVHAKAEALAEGKTVEQAELAAMASISGKTGQQIIELAQTNPQAYQQLQQTAAAFPSEFEKSELGLVPKGWEISTFKDYATFVKGKKPKNIYLKQEGELLPHILVSSLNGEYKEFANPENMTLVSSHETIMLMDGSGSGKISIGHDGIIGSTLAKLKLNDKKYWAFIYLFLSSKTDDIQNNTTGAAIPHTDKNRVYGYPISMPNDKLLNLINKLLDGIFSKIQVHTNENQTLAKTRDTLLPKLLSGEIEL